MIDIDLAAAQRLVNEAIELKGADYIYPKQNGSCKYVHFDGFFEEDTDEYVTTSQEPGCIVGYAMWIAGVPLEELRRDNEDSAVGLASNLQHRGKVAFSAEAVDYLSMVQISQDKGATWGNSDERAKQGEVWRPAYGDPKWIGYEAHYGSKPSDEFDEFLAMYKEYKDPVS